MIEMLDELFVRDVFPLRGRLIQQASLADYTSWRAGGCADYLYLPADIKDLIQFLKRLPLETPITFLGLGSNTLIRDKGIEGVVIVTQGGLNNLSLQSEKLIRADSGVSAAQLARFSARLGLTGLEFMAGIPGTVGGALAMNAGCFGGETWSHVHSVEVIDRLGGIRRRPAIDFEVGYRQVIRPQDEWFAAGFFKLQPGDKHEALDKIKQLLEKRNASQPTGTANCGSVFRNPKERYAGQLIEACGLKGKKIGGASISQKHANFIINENDASAADIENLIFSVKNEVLAKTGIHLETEVCIIGRT